jgi:hypothetical protein
VVAASSSLQDASSHLFAFFLQQWGLACGEYAPSSLGLQSCSTSS